MSALNSPTTNKLEMFVETRILNPDSEFRAKGLCDGPTFTAGSSCFFTCTYCYVEAMMNRGGSAVCKAIKTSGRKFQDLIIRRSDARQRLRAELDSLSPETKFSAKVVYASPAVDVAATDEMVLETAGLCEEILSATSWNIRLLSKSPKITAIAEGIDSEWKQRIIFGLSTGTLDDAVATAIEPDAPAPSLRVQALRELQDKGFRTFAMLCPILPQDLVAYIRLASDLIDFKTCEHIWAEVLNRRGKSMERTAQALETAHLDDWACRLRCVFGRDSAQSWEVYARSTFSALTAAIPAPKLRFLQYVSAHAADYWEQQRFHGAIPLGEAVEKLKAPVTHTKTVTAIPDVIATARRREAAMKAWITIRRRRAEAAVGKPAEPAKSVTTTAGLSHKRSAAAKKAWVTIRKNKEAERLLQASPDGTLNLKTPPQAQGLSHE